MIRHLIWIITIGSLWPGKGHAQRYLERAIPYQHHVTVQTEEGLIEAGLLPASTDREADRERWYSWYAKDSIRHTQGGYRGKLLHGQYRELYANHQLKVSGRYDHGLKQGTWFYRDDNGTLRKSSTWRRGSETGRFRIYDEQGQLQRQGRLKDGLEVNRAKKKWWQFWLQRKKDDNQE